MRLQLTLEPYQSQSLSLNYNYSFSAAIYKHLRLGSPEFAEFLHDIGFVLDGKKYKLFSFAVRFEKFLVIKKNYIDLNRQRIHLVISSPLIEEFIQNVVLGSLSENRFEIMADNIKSVFYVTQADILKPISFSNHQKFRLLSPLVASTGMLVNDRKRNRFLRINEDHSEFLRVFNSNLINKYELVNDKPYKGAPLDLIWDKDYLDKQLKMNKKTTRKVTILADMDKPIDYIGNIAPFELKGSPDLMKIGYDCGFGEKNPMGFGLADVVQSKV